MPPAASPRPQLADPLSHPLCPYEIHRAASDETRTTRGGQEGAGVGKNKKSFSFYRNSSSSFFFSFSTRLRSLGDESIHEDRAHLSDATPHPLELKQDPKIPRRKTPLHTPFFFCFIAKGLVTPGQTPLLRVDPDAKKNEVPQKLKPNK